MAEYGSMFAVSGLATYPFFGGWNGPVPITSWLGLTHDKRCDRRLHRQLPRLSKLRRQDIALRHRHDLGALDAAAFAYRSGHEVVLEVLRADRCRHVPRRDVLAVSVPGGAVLKTTYGDRYVVTEADNVATPRRTAREAGSENGR